MREELSLAEFAKNALQVAQRGKFVDLMEEAKAKKRVEHNFRAKHMHGFALV